MAGLRQGMWKSAIWDLVSEVPAVQSNGSCYMGLEALREILG